MTTPGTTLSTSDALQGILDQDDNGFALLAYRRVTADADDNRYVVVLEAPVALSRLERITYSAVIDPDAPIALGRLERIERTAPDGRRARLTAAVLGDELVRRQSREVAR